MQQHRSSLQTFGKNCCCLWSTAEFTSRFKPPERQALSGSTVRLLFIYFYFETRCLTLQPDSELSSSCLSLQSTSITGMGQSLRFFPMTKSTFHFIRGFLAHLHFRTDRQESEEIKVAWI